MASSKDNLKGLFSNPRTRLMVIVMAVLLVVTVVIAMYSLRSRLSGEAGETSLDLSGAAYVKSIPGAINPTEEYAKLVAKQNLDKAKQAEVTGQSAIPTIIRTEKFGEGRAPETPDSATSGVGFGTLSRLETDVAAERGLWFDDLKSSGCSADLLAKAKSQNRPPRLLREAGCTAEQMLKAGYNLAALKEAGFTAAELRKAGFSASDLRAAGFSANDLREAGYSACELKAAGYSLPELVAAGFTQGELRGAGFSEQELSAATGLPKGVTAEQVKAAGCNSGAVTELRRQGVTSKAIRDINGCSPQELAAAGFTSDEIVKAGYSAQELKSAGLDCSQLRQGGRKADELLAAGVCSKADLSTAGFSPSEIAAAEQALLPAGITPAQVRAAGCGADALKALRQKGVSARAVKVLNDCDITSLVKAGYSTTELASAGFSGKELKAAGVSCKQMRTAGKTARELHQEGVCSIDELRAAGFTATELSSAVKESLLPDGVTAAQVRAAGCNVPALKEMREKGVSAKAIFQISGCSIEALKAAGYNPEELAKAGYTARELKKIGVGCSDMKRYGKTARELYLSGSCDEAALKAAGFADAEIKAALAAGKLPGGYTPEKLRADGCKADSLRKARDAGVSAADIRIIVGCTPAVMRAAGYAAAELKTAGYSPRELLDGGFSLKDLKDAGYTAKELHDLGIEPKALKDAGFSAAELRAAGLSAKEVASAGFTIDELKSAGFTARDMVDAGMSLDDLKRAGVSSPNLKTLGKSVKQLLAAGYSPADLRAAGYSAKELREAGVSAKDILAAGYDAKDLKDAGYSIRDLKAAGLTAKDLKAAGFSVKDLKAAGFTPSELRAAGFTPNELIDGGLSAKELKDAGYTVKQLIDAGVSPEKLYKAGVTARELVDAGVPVKDIIAAGAPLQELKNAGVTVEDLRKAGVSAKEIVAAGFTNAEMQASQFSDKDLREAGITPLAGRLTGGAAQDTAALQALRTSSERVDANRRRQDLERLSGLKRQAVNKLVAGWETTVQKYTEGKAPKEGSDKGSSGFGSQSNAGVQSSKLSLDDDAEKVHVKAGDIMFGVIDTAINSDEPGPVLATVVSGKFRGARLIGSLTLPDNAKAVILTFNTMSLRGGEKSFPISSVAIDQKTARTALATGVDSHYFERYGSLLVGSFLEGYGQAVSSAGSSVEITPGSTVITQASRSTSQQLTIAFGKVGSKLGQATAKNFERPPTVYVASGTPVGILITKDAEIAINN